jgi:hypothetical protein
MLLMDGLDAHHTNVFLHKCAEKNVEVIFFVAHSSDYCREERWFIHFRSRRFLTKPMATWNGDAIHY